MPNKFVSPSANDILNKFVFFCEPPILADLNAFISTLSHKEQAVYSTECPVLTGPAGNWELEVKII